MIFLRGIQYSEVESILQYIYLGEAKFYEERINEFLRAVKDLEIKGLSKAADASDQQPDDATDESEEDFNETTKNHTVDKEENMTDDEAEIVGSDTAMQQTESENHTADNDNISGEEADEATDE